MTPRSTIIILTVLAASCSYSDKDFNLNENERSFLSVFKTGTILYYENSKNQVDSFLVIGIDSTQKKESGYLMALPAFNNIFVSIKHLPVDSFISTNQDMTTKKIDTVHEQLICVSKHPQQKETSFSFQFKRFFYYTKNGLGQLHSDTIINNIRLTNYYIIKDNFVDRDTSYVKIEQLYWTQKDGLVAYKQKNGIYWTKKNSR